MNSNYFRVVKEREDRVALAIQEGSRLHETSLGTNRKER